jgi:hypothetical protein
MEGIFMKKIATIAVLFFLSLSGWVWGAAPESYVPLTEGMSWEFQHKYYDMKAKKEIGVAKSIKKNLAPVQLQGMQVTPQLFSFYQPENVLKQEITSFILQDSTGFHVFARKSANDQEPVIQAKYFVLKFPLNKGASWQQKAEGFLVRDVIESLDAEVQVPAGKFSHCLLLKKSYFDPQDPKTAQQEVQLWFAPGVGNVKVITRHPQRNVEIVQELVSFKK